jgi:ADP-dependent phosphofructokinase/glucokinase
MIFALHENLERVHFHSFGWHMLALRSGATTWTDNNNPASAVAKGSVAATERACGGVKVENLHGKQLGLNVGGFYRLTEGNKKEFVEFDVVDGKEVQSWSRSGVEFYVAPVLACLDVKMTVGLGDAISAGGL